MKRALKNSSSDIITLYNEYTKKKKNKKGGWFRICSLRENVETGNYGKI